jgi:hypothetical protein
LNIPEGCITVAKISSQQSPIADLEYPYAFSAIDTVGVRPGRINSLPDAIDNAECIRMFQIGDRRLLIADRP